MTNLLIIDDDDLTLQLYDLLLEDAKDIRFQKAENGTEAINILKKINLQQSGQAEDWPEFIFIDLHMPDMSGYEFVELYQQQFGKEEQRARLYFLTSSVSQRDMKKSQEYSLVSGILPKPLTEDKLQELISQGS